MEKIPVIAIVGPTASGKTALAVELAKIYDAEIISADSMQIYKGMYVATAKPSAEEMQGIKHHLIGFVPVSSAYSVASFVKDANAAAADIYSRGKTVIVAGGTGLYVDSLLGNTAYEDEPDNSGVRALLYERRDREGIQKLYGELCSIDPEYASQLCVNNEKRVLRALEIYYLTGEKPSDRRKRAIQHESPYVPLYIGLRFNDRELLCRRIEQRVDRMLADGLLKEAEEYFALDEKCTASQAIGYKEFAPYLNGGESFETAREKLIRSTRRYAKRQMTWFNRNGSINWISCDGISRDEILSSAQEIITNSGLFERK